MRGFFLSLGVHAAGVSALLAVPVLSTSELPPVPKPPVTLPRFPTTVSIVKPPPVGCAHASRGHSASTAPRVSSQAPPEISDAPLDPDAKSGVLDADIEADWGDSSAEGAGIIPGLPPGPGEGRSEATRLVRAHFEVQPPRRLTGPEPVYPPLARLARQEAQVILECTIATDGRVIDIRLLRGHPLFDAAATFAVERWLYKPTLLNGVPVAVLMTVTVDFRLR